MLLFESFFCRLLAVLPLLLVVVVRVRLVAVCLVLRPLAVDDVPDVLLLLLLLCADPVLPGVDGDGEADDIEDDTDGEVCCWLLLLNCCC